MRNLQVSADEYYPILALPVFPAPAHVTGEEYEGGIELVGYVSAPPAQRAIEEFADKHDAQEVAVYSLRWPVAWARMFAKIAYCLAVREYGLHRSKSNVYVLNAILGETDDIGMWVGCVGEQVYSVHEFKDQVAGLWLRDGEVHAVIKLFAWLNTVPEYQVIVGKLPSA